MPEPASLPILARAVASIGWDRKGLARRLGMNERKLRRVLDGEAPAPAALSAWLLELASAHERWPTPAAYRAAGGRLDRLAGGLRAAAADIGWDEERLAARLGVGRRVAARHLETDGADLSRVEAGWLTALAGVHRLHPLPAGWVARPVGRIEPGQKV
jgi:hypothetical protein